MRFFCPQTAQNIGRGRFQISRREDGHTAAFRPLLQLLIGHRSTDAAFHPLKDGEPVKNLFCIGSVLGGTRKEDYGTAAGLAIRTAFAVVDTIKGGNV